MRLFQNSGVYPAYLARLDRLAAGIRTFAGRKAIFLADRYGAAHFLQPVLEDDPSAFFTNADDPTLQALWAREHGLPRRSSADEILLAQIEEHRTEVFYNIDPTRTSPDFITRLPGCVRRKVAWRAAPSPGADLRGYDLVVCNFASILERYAEAGWKVAYFAPAHDPAMDRYAAAGDRPVDVVFVGGYTRHHKARAALLESIAALAGRYSIVMHLNNSRLTRLAESPLGRLGPLRSHRRPSAVRQVARDPAFGVDMYAALAQAKIVVNAAIDMAGPDRGNMRCFEATGCGCLLLSDEGVYPAGMTPGETMVTYAAPADAVAQLVRLLADEPARRGIAAAGRRMVAERYSKARQWERFVELSA